MVSLQGLVSVTSFLVTRALPLRIISSNWGFMCSLRRIISSILAADSSASSFNSSGDSRMSRVSRYQISKLSTWLVKTSSTVDTSLKKSSRVWTVLTIVSNFFWTSLILVSIFLVSLTLLEFWMNCWADSKSLWMEGSCDTTSDLRTFNCLVGEWISEKMLSITSQPKN